MFLSYSSSHDFRSATVHLLNGSLSQSCGWKSDWFVFTIRLKELYTKYKMKAYEEDSPALETL